MHVKQMTLANIDSPSDPDSAFTPSSRKSPNHPLTTQYNLIWVWRSVKIFEAVETRIKYKTWVPIFINTAQRNVQFFCQDMGIIGYGPFAWIWLLEHIHTTMQMSLYVYNPRKMFRELLDAVPDMKWNWTFL